MFIQEFLRLFFYVSLAEVAFRLFICFEIKIFLLCLLDLHDSVFSLIFCWKKAEAFFVREWGGSIFKNAVINPLSIRFHL